MGITRLFEISRTSFRALDAAMNVTGQNIANVESDGYVRRRVALQPVDASSSGLFTGRTGGDPSGVGVQISGYDRLKDSLLEQSRTESRSTLSFANEQQRIMGAVETLFPAGFGSLDDSLEQFWNSWSDLADHPTDSGVRSSLRERARTLSSRLNELDRQVDTVISDTRLALSDSVDEANHLLNRIKDLNTQIAYATHSDNPDFAAEDQRDLAVRELGELVPLQMQYNEDSSVNLYLNGMALVTPGALTELNLDLVGPTPSLTIGTTGIELETGTDSGTLGAQMVALTGDLSGITDDLDALAAALVSEVNTLHSTGYGDDGATGRDFFDASGVTAGTISLSSDVEGSIAAIAASGDAAALGDNSVALDILDLRDALVLDGNTRSIGDYAIDVVAGIGSTVQAARQRAAGAESSLAGLDAMAKSVSGVSLDEEMIQLIRLQQAFGAAARVLRTAEEMFDILMTL